MRILMQRTIGARKAGRNAICSRSTLNDSDIYSKLIFLGLALFAMLFYLFNGGYDLPPCRGAEKNIFGE
jgi:hypothetical protein